MSVRFVTGGVATGKTTRMIALLAQAPEGTAGGVIAPRRMSGALTVGYDLLLLPGTERMRLADRHMLRPEDTGHVSVVDSGPPHEAVDPDVASFGPYLFRQTAFDKAFAHLAALMARPGIRTLYLDEIGPLELQGRGHAPALETLLPLGKHWVLAVRGACLERVRRWCQELAPVQFEEEADQTGACMYAANSFSVFSTPSRWVRSYPWEAYTPGPINPCARS